MNLIPQRRTHGQVLPVAVLCFSMVALSFAHPCQTLVWAKSFSHRECLDTIPKKVLGLKVLTGPRTEKSLIQDMVPVVCYCRVVLEKLKSTGEKVPSGKVIFRIAVEYTGEVYRAEIVETSIQSQQFLRKISDIIMDTDFVNWVRNDTDTVFLYPMSF